jgi:hypothetical protein
MKHRAALILSVMAMAAAQVASAQTRLGANLTGFEETPGTVSTVATGQFDLVINQDETAISFELSYTDLEGSVTQAHIHFGRRATSGGISVWLCGNPNPPAIVPPAGTPLCPPSPATVEGTRTAADVVGPTGQGIAPGEFAELIRAIRDGSTYANVHSTKFPGGEIRNQIGPGHSQ